MVKHIVMWTFRDDVKADAFDEKMNLLESKFSAMLGVVPDLHAIKFSRTYKAGNFDAVLVCDFADKAAEEAYQTNPVHLEVKAIIHQWVDKRASADYEY